MDFQCLQRTAEQEPDAYRNPLAAVTRFCRNTCESYASAHTQACLRAYGTIGGRTLRSGLSRFDALNYSGEVRKLYAFALVNTPAAQAVYREFGFGPAV
jgi:hypothetical protein